jgi:hypothetical protein
MMQSVQDGHCNTGDSSARSIPSKERRCFLVSTRCSLRFHMFGTLTLSPFFFGTSDDEKT